MSYIQDNLAKTELMEALDIASLVPQRYAAYRPLVMDGLIFFLERLDPERLAAIFAEQLQMPEEAGVAERVVALLHHCPTLHKLGQVVARDQRLDPELRKRLQGLESLSPTTPMAEVLALIHSELGERSDIEVFPEALAEASVAVVVPFTWHESDSASPQEGVFKVLKPGMEARLREELAIWPELGAFLEERCARYGLPALDYRETLNSVRHLLLNEIQLDREQAHLTQAAQFYADTPEVLIPRLLPFSSRRLTAMERIYGDKVTQADSFLPPDRRQRLATTIVEALIARPFWSEAPLVAFHADPHAGNLFATPDGRLAVLDWSLVVYLTQAQREAIVQMVLGALTLDEARLCRAIISLGRRAPEEAALRAAVAEALRQVRWGVFPGFSWLLGLLDRLATAAGMGFAEDLVLFRKALLTLSGVITDVSAVCSADRVLLNSALKQFLHELAAGRELSLSDNRSFGTHVSNRDLFFMWIALPITASRLWIDNWRDVLKAVPAVGDSME